MCSSIVSSASRLHFTTWLDLGGREGKIGGERRSWGGDMGRHWGVRCPYKGRLSPPHHIYPPPLFTSILSSQLLEELKSHTPGLILILYIIQHFSSKKKKKKFDQSTVVAIPPRGGD